MPRGLIRAGRTLADFGGRGVGGQADENGSGHAHVLNSMPGKRTSVARPDDSRRVLFNKRGGSIGEAWGIRPLTGAPPRHGGGQP